MQYSRYIKIVEPDSDDSSDDPDYKDRAYVSKINYLNSKKLQAMRNETLKLKFGFASMLN